MRRLAVGLLCATLLPACPKGDPRGASGDPEIAFRAGVAALASEARGGIDYEAAYRSFAEAERLGAGPRASFDAGFAAERSGRPTDAVAHYRRAADADPSYTAAAVSLVTLLIAAGEHDEAVSRSRARARARPSDEAHQQLLWVLVTVGRHEEALALARDLLRRHPADPEIYLALSRSYAAQGDRGLAKLTADKALALDPSSARTLNDLGLLALEAGAPAEATARFQAALALDPNEPSANANLGLLALGAGDYARAAHHLAQASGHDPADRGLQMSLATALRGTSDHSGAAAVYDALLATNPDDREVLSAEADLYADAMEQPKRALGILRAYTDRHPELAADDPLLAQIAQIEHEGRRTEPVAAPDPEVLLAAARAAAVSLRSSLEIGRSCLAPEKLEQIEAILDQSESLLAEGDATMAGDVLLVLDEASAEVAGCER